MTNDFSILIYVKYSNGYDHEFNMNGSYLPSAGIQTEPTGTARLTWSIDIWEDVFTHKNMPTELWARYGEGSTNVGITTFPGNATGCVELPNTNQ